MDFSTPDMTAVSNPKRKPPSAATIAYLNAVLDLGILDDFSFKITRKAAMKN
jgi:hypothetical protein